VGNGATGNANNFQYPPGNPSGGHPVPIITAAGIVYPANYLPDTTQSGITPAGNGTAKAGFGGSQAGCSSGSVSFSDSVPGSGAVGAVGGTGGNASSLGPMDPTCSGNSCFDAGPGGGGGGGYFGGGGGATGVDKVSGNCGVCNGAGSGLEGGGGSSFTSNETIDPVDESSVLGAGAGIVIIVPVIEIDAPANGAVYTPGQIVDASWACAFDNTSPGTDLGPGGSCTGTVANGSAIDTSPGTHTFTVSGTVYSNGYHPIGATVTYTVAKPGAGGGKHVSASAGGFTFTLAGPGSSVKKGSKLTVTLAKAGKGKNFKARKYKYYVKSTHKPPILVTKHTGTFRLSLSGLGSGNHTLTLVITLNSTKHAGKTKTVTLKLPFKIG
jgi:hypothetical protein